MSYVISAPFAGMLRTSEGKKELHSADGESYVMQVCPGKWESVFQGTLLGTPETREKARDLVRAAKRKAGSASPASPAAACALHGASLE